MADSSGLDRIPVQVRVTLDNGERLQGSIGVIRGRKLGDLLNSGAQFILLETNGGEPVYLSVSSIQSITSSHVPAADQLAQSTKSLENASLHKLLRVSEDCTRETLHRSYHTLAKLYHPDQYANVRLPEEVAAYISDMLKRINMAFSELDSQLQRREAAAQAQQAEMRKARRFGT